MIAEPIAPRGSWLLPDNKVSFSSLQLFHDCPECWYLRYIQHLPSPTHVALPRGGAVHAGLQHAREGALAGGSSDPGSAADFAVARFEEDWAAVPDALRDLGEYLNEANARDDVALLTRAAVTTFLPEDLKVGIWAVEPRIDFDGVFPFAFEGYADCILNDLTIQDAKTSGKAGEPDEWARLQLRIYGIPFAQEGRLPRGRIQKVWPRNDRALGRVAEAHSWTWDWTPWHFEKARSWVFQTAGTITDAMRSGDFPPRPGWKCKWPHFEEVA